MLLCDIFQNSQYTTSSCIGDFNIQATAEPKKPGTGYFHMKWLMEAVPAIQH